MALTSHLKDANSRVRQFIYAAAPDLALAGTRSTEGTRWATELGFDELTAMDTQIPIPVEVKSAERQSHAVIAGIALDYRIRMDLPKFDISETAARKGLHRFERNLDIVHRGKHIYRLLSEATLGLAYLTLQEKDPHPLSLARASVPLAWCEAIYRAGPATALNNDLGKQIKRAKNSGELMMRVDETLLFDIARMHAPIAELLAQWTQEIAEGMEYEPNPTFLGSPAVGGADGALVISDLLIDVKTREQITNPWLRECLFQLLEYVLLDLDVHGIRRVGILLPRQVHMQTWSLDELLGRDAEEALPELRDNFTELLAELLEDRIAVDETSKRSPGLRTSRRQ